MVTRTTFKSNKGKEYKCITIFEIIHQGPQDTIIYYIQNEKVGVNGDNFSMLFLWSLILKQSKTLIFEKRSSGHT